MVLQELLAGGRSSFEEVIFRESYAGLFQFREHRLINFFQNGNVNPGEADGS